MILHLCSYIASWPGPYLAVHNGGDTALVVDNGHLVDKMCSFAQTNVVSHLHTRVITGLTTRLKLHTGH